MSQDARTSKVISEMLSVLASENSFEVAMNEMLRMVYDITGADRVIVFECHGETTEITFERCAGGVEPQIGTVSPLSASVLNAWFKSAVDNPVALIPNAAILAQFSPALHEWCVNSGIESLMAAPFRNEGEIVGFLGAYNYHIDDSGDVNRVFSAISSFVGARIENRRLINSLEWAGKHDALTGLLNRRGASEALNAIIGEQPNAPFVLALIDLDDFKNTNDQYGHSAGDEALYTLGRFMTRAFPEDAILSRAGGDEFLVGMVGENADRADDLFANFASMPKNFEYEGAQLSISTSIGYAFRDEQAQTIAKVYTNADTALYVMKREGKAGVRKFSR